MFKKNLARIWSMIDDEKNQEVEETERREQQAFLETVANELKDDEEEGDGAEDVVD